MKLDIRKIYKGEVESIVAEEDCKLLCINGQKAIKLVSKHLDDLFLAIVAVERPNGIYATYTLNMETRSLNIGHYYENEENALTDFLER